VAGFRVCRGRAQAVTGAIAGISKSAGSYKRVETTTRSGNATAETSSPIAADGTAGQGESGGATFDPGNA
jgi:hypothetical protein